MQPHERGKRLRMHRTIHTPAAQPAKIRLVVFFMIVLVSEERHPSVRIDAFQSCLVCPWFPSLHFLGVFASVHFLGVFAQGLERCLCTSHPAPTAVQCTNYLTLYFLYLFFPVLLARWLRDAHPVSHHFIHQQFMDQFLQ